MNPVKFLLFFILALCVCAWVDAEDPHAKEQNQYIGGLHDHKF